VFSQKIYISGNGEAKGSFYDVDGMVLTCMFVLSCFEVMNLSFSEEKKWKALVMLVVFRRCGSSDVVRCLRSYNERLLKKLRNRCLRIIRVFCGVDGMVSTSHCGGDDLVRCLRSNDGRLLKELV